MAADAIVFAMANPEPEIAPEAVVGLAAVVATGRSDLPNQINNVLAFPGVFRGALADVVGDDELASDSLVPSVFNREVVPAVATAVATAAEASGVARKRCRPTTVTQRDVSQD